MDVDRLIQVSHPSSLPAAEAQTAPPVPGGEDWFHIAGLAAVAEGHISQAALENVMRILYPEVPNAE